MRTVRLLTFKSVTLFTNVCGKQSNRRTKGVVYLQFVTDQVAYRHTINIKIYT
jgi:hypothetical protein